MARHSFTEHPKFMDAGHSANAALRLALIGMGLVPSDVDSFYIHASRITDDLTRLLLRAYDAKQIKSQAA